MILPIIGFLIYLTIGYLIFTGMFECVEITVITKEPTEDKTIYGYRIIA